MTPWCIRTWILENINNVKEDSHRQTQSHKLYYADDSLVIIVRGY